MSNIDVEPQKDSHTVEDSVLGALVDRPTLVSTIAQRARVTNRQARSALAALIASGDAVEVWHDTYETTAYARGRA